MPTPRKFNYKGKLMTIRQIAAKVKMKPKTLSERLRQGRSVAEAVLTGNRMNNSPVTYGLYRELKESFIGDSETGESVYC